ncbi:uncharacterized protein LOC110735184 [Chenopodium quinoa]|uniref:uncharacterized protein LOC110735184 n=1 Tax=Chenopodium quinoa TaxID=63459 RepID=UPI000B76C3A0|nr:uncharacterized protein LOC110735184 [Chenopodium quinoa]
MGRNRQSKTKKKKKRLGDDLVTQVTKLINSVSDAEIINVTCEIPSNEILDALNIPVPSVQPPSHEWLGKNLLIGVGEWGDALDEILKEDNVDFEDENVDNYSTFSAEKQTDYRRRMIDVVRKNRRRTMYRKWLYAQKKEYLADWSKTDNWEDYESVGEENVVAEGEDEVAEEGEGVTVEEGVGVAVEEGVAELGEEGVIWEGEDFITCCGYNPFSGVFDSAVIDNRTVLIDYPKFIHGDKIVFYEGVFSLASWYKNHKLVELRYLPNYRYWNAYKLTRELLAIVQVLVNSILNHIIDGNPHGGLNDLKNYKISQFVENHVGSKKIKFRVELINPRESVVGLSQDMEQFISVLHKLFEGGTPDVELLGLPNMLRSSLINAKGCEMLVLRNYPALWDAEERVAFYVNLYNRYVNDDLMKKKLNSCFKVAAHINLNFPLSWQAKISRGSVFDHILRYPTDQDPSDSIKYSDADVVDMLRFIRNVFHYFCHVPGGYSGTPTFRMDVI